MCSRAGIVITAGAEGGAWGDVLLTNAKLRDTRAARALTYVEVARFGRTDLWTVADAHPDSKRGAQRAIENAAPPHCHARCC